MKRTALLRDVPPCAAPDGISEDVLAVSQIVEHDGKSILNIDLFYDGVLRGRYFADIKEKCHNANVDGKWYRCSLNNVARVCKGKETLKGYDYYFDEDWKYASNADADRAWEYLGNRIDTFEYKTNQVKYERAYQRKRQRIDSIMNAIPCIPDGVEAWLDEEIFPGDYLFFKRDKRTGYTCTACRAKSWRKKPWKHGEMTTCPKCGAEVKAYSRRNEIMKREPVVILQPHGEGWLERQCLAECRWSSAGKEIKIYEEIRVIIGKSKCYGTEYYGTRRFADETEQDWWDRNGANKHFAPSYLYPDNLQETLPCGGLEHSGLDVIAKEKVKLNINRFILRYNDQPWLEYLIKAGLYRLAADIANSYYVPELICPYGSSPKGTLQLDGNRVNRLKQLNGGLNTLGWLQYEEESEFDGRRIKISQESLEYLDAKKVRLEDCRMILQELGSVNRMVNYLKKQKESPRTVVQTWRDYLRMARQEGLDVTDDIVRLPKDLEARHDQLVERINARRDEERRMKEKEKYAYLDARIRERLTDVKRYFWEDDTYMIVPAGRCEELVEEGRALHHCVGANDFYMTAMADGRSWILFLRRKSELDKPYYTIEINMYTDEIKQYYSAYDRQPDKEVIRKVLDKFRRSLRKTQRIPA
ncbi:hypothetical protein BN3660_01130 [Eubacteriaceae bacterium CHKCI004]|nr:hypothetical protein BN3660_01130 [Eubacteriaceae bacterium CHKCI004]